MAQTTAKSAGGDQMKPAPTAAEIDKYTKAQLQEAVKNLNRDGRFQRLSNLLFGAGENNANRLNDSIRNFWEGRVSVAKSRMRTEKLIEKAILDRTKVIESLPNFLEKRSKARAEALNARAAYEATAEGAAEAKAFDERKAAHDKARAEALRKTQTTISRRILIKNTAKVFVSTMILGALVDVFTHNPTQQNAAAITVETKRVTSEAIRLAPKFKEENSSNSNFVVMFFESIIHWMFELFKFIIRSSFRIVGGIKSSVTPGKRSSSAPPPPTTRRGRNTTTASLSAMASTQRAANWTGTIPAVTTPSTAMMQRRRARSHSPPRSQRA